jgi:hypothetical protein
VVLTDPEIEHTDAAPERWVESIMVNCLLIGFIRLEGASVLVIEPTELLEHLCVEVRSRSVK